jgi:hypothetical protein
MAMSRRRKLILFLVVAPVVLVTLVVALAFTSAVQTFAVRKVLAGEGGEVENVSAGFGGASLRGLRIEQPGLKLSVPDFRADAPLMDLVGGKIEVRALVARDIVIEIDPEKMKAAQKPSAEQEDVGPAKPFDGVLNAVELPELRVDGIDIAGRLRVVGAQALDATFALTGGGIRAGQAGKLELKVEAKAGLGSVVTTFTLAPTLGADGRLDALGAVAEALATSKLLSRPAKLRAKIDIARQASGEAYGLRLLAGETPLVELDTQWAPGAKELPGRWKIAIRDADLAPFAMGLALPEFSLSGGGDLAILGTDKLRLGGALDFAADGLETLGLPKLGPVALDSKFSVEAGATDVRIESFLANLKGSAPVLSVRVAQPFGLVLETKKIVPSRAGSDLAEITLLGVPAEWVKTFVPELSIGGSVTGAWTARAEGDGFVLATSQPLVANQVGYASAGQPLVNFDAVRVEGLRAKQTSAGLEASVAALRVVANGADLVTVKVDATRKAGAPLLAKGEIKAWLSKLADQPVLRGQTRLSAGEATVTFDASAAEALKAVAQIRLAGLRAAGAGDLPEVVIDADVARDAAGVLSAKVPLSVRNAKASRASDMLLQATVKPSGATTHISAKLSSQVIFREDLQAFAALAAESTPASTPKPATPGSTPADPQAKPAQGGGPLWAGMTGEVELAFARIVYAPGVEVTDTQGRFALSPDAATLEKLKLLLGTGGSLDVTGALKWLPATKSYTLGADVKGREVKVGPLLKALAPAEASKLEGTYDLTASITGQGGDPAAAASGAAADFKLTGKQGVIRALNFDNNKYAKLGTSAVGKVAGLLGAVVKDEKTVQIAGYASAVVAITNQLSNLPYDQIEIQATRAADGSIEIGKIDLLSPQIQLSGAGGMRAVPGRAWWELPMRIQAQLGARGEVAQNLAKLDLLAPAPEGANADAFARMKDPLVFDGTLLQVGTAQVSKLFSRSIGL